jgi:hypothetical protein
VRAGLEAVRGACPILASVRRQSVSVPCAAEFSLSSSDAGTSLHAFPSVANVRIVPA